MNVDPNQEITELQIRTLGTQEAYILFRSYNPPETEVMDAIHGTRGTGFYIQDYFDGTMTRKGEYIYWKGMRIKKISLDEELQRRTMNMKQYLIRTLFEKDSWLKARGGKDGKH